MRVRLPLYGKILGWFFLNLVIVASVFVVLFNAQFRFDLDWFFASGARERIEAVRDLILGELAITSPDDWSAVIRRYSEAHHVRFSIFDDEAKPFVGEVTKLPDDVFQRIVSRPQRVQLAPPHPGEADAREALKRALLGIEIVEVQE